MADLKHKVLDNVDGEFFVDTTCIDCDTCRELAPATFADNGTHSFVQRQPSDAVERRAALRALVACPTGSIGASGSRKDEIAAAALDFPLEVTDGVAYCGYASPDSFGASSYFIADPRGNWLVDAPRWNRRLEQHFESRGGLAYIFLTHRDDIADSARWSERFGAARVIHEGDLDALPEAEIVLHGLEPASLGEGFLAIPTPGHTRGHAVLLHRDEILFGGDHLWWSRNRGRLWASHAACWYDWGEQTRSMERLLELRFTWILPGHGDRASRSLEEMHGELVRLVETMRSHP